MAGGRSGSTTSVRVGSVLVSPRAFFNRKANFPDVVATASTEAEHLSAASFNGRAIGSCETCSFAFAGQTNSADETGSLNFNCIVMRLRSAARTSP